jgi:hypothetical protein
MPAVSKAQRRLAAMVMAGKATKTKAFTNMAPNELRKFATTPEKGLPMHKGHNDYHELDVPYLSGAAANYYGEGVHDEEFELEHGHGSVSNDWDINVKDPGARQPNERYLEDFDIGEFFDSSDD